MSIGTSDQIATRAYLGTAVAKPARGVPRKRLSIALWAALFVGALYFLIPLAATVQFSFDSGRGFSLHFYQSVLTTPEFYKTIEFSLVLAVLTCIAGIALILPTAYWVNLRLPWFRPVMSFMTLMPFVIPPVILSLGLLQSWGGTPLPVLGLTLPVITGTPFFLVGAYVVLGFPYLYGSIDNGLRAMDIHTLTEAAQSLGANLGVILWRVILPNLWPAIVSGALLTSSIVMGEFDIASLFGYNTFPIYLNVTGQFDPNGAAALTIISFAITWLCLAVIQAVANRAPGGMVRAGGR